MCQDQIQFHLPASGSAGIPEGSRRTQTPCARRQGLSQRAQRLQEKNKPMLVLSYETVTEEIVIMSVGQHSALNEIADRNLVSAD